jgi:ABC-type bacteriocin/lantibiotic exporter with double-glycine peptidase domain
MVKELKSIFKYIGGGWRYIGLILLRSPVNILFTLINAWFLQHAFNTIIAKDNVQLKLTCINFGLASFGLFLYNGLVWSVCAASFVTKAEGRLRRVLFNKITSLSCEQIESKPQGEWITKLNMDVQMPFSEAYVQTAAAVMSCFVSAIILLMIHPSMFGLVLLFVIPHILCSQLLVARHMMRLQNISLEAAACNTEDLAALINCGEIALLYDGQEYLMKRFEQSSLAIQTAHMNIHKRNALSSGILPLFGLGGYLAILTAGGELLGKGDIRFGELTAIFQYRNGLLAGIFMLLSGLITIQGNRAGIRRLIEMMRK